MAAVAAVAVGGSSPAALAAAAGADVAAAAVVAAVVAVAAVAAEGAGRQGGRTCLRLQLSCKASPRWWEGPGGRAVSGGQGGGGSGQPLVHGRQTPGLSIVIDLHTF